jgi:chromosome segregation ATPase
MFAALPATAGIIAAVLTAITAPIGAYLLAARKMSGKIDTSSAGELWAESRLIRDDYRSRLLAAAERTTRLEERIAKLEGINVDLLRENLELKQKVGELQTIIEELNATITRLVATVAAQTAELKERP